MNSITEAISIEEQGDRWRNSDLNKAAGLYEKAVGDYEKAFAVDSKNFTARYNRARLLYSLTQLPLPRNLSLYPGTKEAKLKEAVDAHAECEALQKGVGDLLFNYGQCVGSLGEYYAENFAMPRGMSDEQCAKGLMKAKETLDRAWKIFRECLEVQLAEYKGTPEDDDMTNEDGGVRLPSVDSITAASAPSETVDVDMESESDASQWASVLPPTTLSSLLDTAIAMLDIQTAMLSLPTSRVPTTVLFTTEEISSLQKFATDTLDSYILPLTTTLCTELSSSNEDQATLKESEEEALICRANYLTALAEVYYNLYPDTGFDRWESKITEAFAPFTFLAMEAKGPDGSPVQLPKRTLDLLSTSWKFRCDRSNAYASLLTASMSKDPQKAWDAGKLADADLKKATNLAPKRGWQGSETFAGVTGIEIYLARGKLEILRSRITGLEAAELGKAQLRKNAAIYFNNGVESINPERRTVMDKLGALDQARGTHLAKEAKALRAFMRFEDGEGNLFQGQDRTEMRDGILRAEILPFLRAAEEEGLFSDDIEAKLYFAGVEL